MPGGGISRGTGIVPRAFYSPWGIPGLIGCSNSGGDTKLYRPPQRASMAQWWALQRAYHITSRIPSKRPPLPHPLMMAIR